MTAQTMQILVASAFVVTTAALLEGYLWFSRMVEAAGHDPSHAR